MGFVEEEYHLRFFKIADFGQSLEELGQHPQKEGRVEFSVGDEVARVEYLDDSAALIVRHEPVAYIEIRLTEERIAAVHLKRHDAPRDNIERSARDLAVVSRQLVSMLANEPYHRLEVLEVDQQQLVVVRDLEDDRQKVALQIVELQDPGHEKGTDLGHRRPQLDAVLPENVPERHGIAVVVEVRLSEAEALDPLLHVLAVLAGKHHSRDVALDVSHEHRNARIRERLGEDLQRHRLTGTRRTRDQPVAVRHLRQNIDVVARVVVGDPEKIIEIHLLSPSVLIICKCL